LFLTLIILLSISHAINEDMIAHYKFILQLQQNLGMFNRTKWEARHR
jgi:hypothetical protein